jgi:hypothetical protein
MLKKIASWAIALSLVLGLGFGSTLRAADSTAPKADKTAAAPDEGATPKKHHKKHHHKKAAAEEPAAAPSK